MAPVLTTLERGSGGQDLVWWYDVIWVAIDQKHEKMGTKFSQHQILQVVKLELVFLTV